MSSQETITDASLANEQLQHLKRDLPPVFSAYKPSGKIPLRETPRMLFATIPAFFISVVTGLLVALAGGVVLAVFWWLLISLKLVIPIVPSIVTIILWVASFFAMYALIGLAVPSGTVRIAKNRNATFASVLSVLTALAASISLWIIMQHVAVWFADRAAATPPTVLSETPHGVIKAHTVTHMLSSGLNLIFSTTAFGWVCLSVGSITAAIISRLVAVKEVRSSKFCERCGRYMVSPTIKTVSIASAIKATQHLKAGAINKAISAIEQDSGVECKISLDHCPECNNGYLELTVNFIASWRETKTEGGTERVHTLSDSWLVASRYIDSTHVKKIRSLQSTAGQPGV
jgi:hypothetical protein